MVSTKTLLLKHYYHRQGKTLAFVSDLVSQKQKTEGVFQTQTGTARIRHLRLVSLMCPEHTELTILGLWTFSSLTLDIFSNLVQNIIVWGRGGGPNAAAMLTEFLTPDVRPDVRMHARGALLLTVEILACLLTIGVFLLTALAFLFTVGAFLLTVGKCIE